MATKVGYKMSSSNFVVAFLSATQNGKNSQLLEEFTDWRGVMKILLYTLEKHPTDLNAVIDESCKSLEEWAYQQQGGPELQLKININKINRSFTRFDKHKFFFVHFSDLYRTNVMFDIKRKNGMTSLRTIAARKIAGCILKKEDVKELEIPKVVMPDVEEAFKDSWKVSYIRTSSKKRKISELTLNDLRKKKDCPYCGRQNFKKIVTHVMRNSDCHHKYNTQLEYNLVVNKCFW